MARPSATVDLAKIRAVQATRTLPEDEAWTLLGPVTDRLPVAWRTSATTEDGLMVRRPDGLAVILSVAREKDERRWLHLSTSRPDRLPSYDDLCEVKRLFLGPERKAIQVFAPTTEHINIHKRCLHLWCCLDGDPLPDFTHETGSL